MKKIISLFLVFILLLGLCAAVQAQNAGKEIQVFYLGKEIVFNVPPQIIKGNTMVPMRAIFEALGYQINWDGNAKSVTAVKGNKSISITVGSETAKVNGQIIKLLSPAVNKNGSVLVSLRFVGENSGYDVLWDDVNRNVYIENRNPNEYDSVQKLGGTMGRGVGNCLLFTDVDKHLYADLYMTTFDGKEAVRLLDGSALREEKLKTQSGGEAPYSYVVAPYAPDKAVVCAEHIDMFDVDANTKSTGLLKQYLPDNRHGANDVKVFGDYLYFTDFVKQNDCMLQVNLKTGKKTTLFNLPKDTLSSYGGSLLIIDYTITGNTMVLSLFGDNPDWKTSDVFFYDYLYVYNFETKAIEQIERTNGISSIQEYKDSVYLDKNDRLYRYNVKTNDMTPISPENIVLADFQILNDTVFYTTKIKGSDGKYHEDFYRSPLDFSYQIKLSSKINYYWDVVGNHIIYKPEGNFETFMMNIDGTGAVMIRKTGRKYVDTTGTPVDDVLGVK